jgi:hypothetical protein
MVDRKMTRTAQLLYIVMIPVTFSTIGKEAVRITLASLKAVFTGKSAIPRRRRRGRQAAVGQMPRRPEGTTWQRPVADDARKERIPEGLRTTQAAPHAHPHAHEDEGVEVVLAAPRRRTAED